MRLFTAIDPSPEVHASLVQLLERLRPSARLRWSRPEGLHVTLKFIGEFPESRLPALHQALGSVPAPAAIPMEVSGLGFFPDVRAPRVFWAGIAAPPELKKLVAEIDRALQPLGVAVERRPYSPHLTLARIEQRTPLEGLHAAVQELASTRFGCFTARSFYLYESRAAAGGSVYIKLAEFPPLT